MVREGEAERYQQCTESWGWGCGVWWRNQEMQPSGAGVKGQPRNTGAWWRLHSESGPASQKHHALRLGGFGHTVPDQHPGHIWLDRSRHGPHPCTCYLLLDLSVAQDVWKGHGSCHYTCEPWQPPKALPGTGEHPQHDQPRCTGPGGALIYRWGWGWSGHLDPGWKRGRERRWPEGGGMEHMQNARRQVCLWPCSWLVQQPRTSCHFLSLVLSFFHL